jgi:tetratricopeptide (TPR) repeat protein
MNITDCYRLLELNSQASLAEVKASYRRLARQYHPDVNPGDRRAQDKFIQVTEAYKLLVVVVAKRPPASSQPSPTATRITRKPPPAPAPVSAFDKNLKQTAYAQLQELLKYQRFPRAIALIEGLAQRLPEDREVRQWQAITYQCWGRHLIGLRQVDKARIYLKKALRTDPHNTSLWAEVERDFRKLERVI